MKVAAVVVTYNDDYKLNQWYGLFNICKESIYKYIIVDNGSSLSFIEKLRANFPGAFIIRRIVNGGCTAAYNDGIRFALADKTVDAIMLIGNDIKITANSIRELYDFLHSNSNYGMVAPAILSKDSERIESVGCYISSFLYLKEPEVGELICNVKNLIYELDTVAGGMNLAKRDFYINVGLQDEGLFMYSDEVDMGIRAKRVGYKIAVTTTVKSWHQHLNPDGRIIRRPYSAYLMGRNKIYLSYKHFGFIKVVGVFFFHLILFFARLFTSFRSLCLLRYNLFFLLGTFAGLFKINKNFEFILSNK